MYKPENFRSIGWLNGVNQTVLLTPVLNDSCLPIFIRISDDEFKLVKDDKKLMLEMACDCLNRLGNTLDNFK